MRRALAYSLTVFLLPALAQAQVAIDAVSQAESAVPGTSTTHNHTLGGAATWIGVCVSTRDHGLAIQPVTSVTVGGVSAMLVDRAQTSNNGISAELWHLPSPPTGVQSIVVTNDAVNERTVTTAISLTGTATSSMLGTAITATDPGSANANVDVDVIPSAVGELGIVCGAARVDTTTVAADPTAPVSTERVERAHADSTSLIGFLYSEDGAATSINMRMDLTPAERWAAVGVSVKPLVATTPRKRGAVFYP